MTFHNYYRKIETPHPIDLSVLKLDPFVNASFYIFVLSITVNDTDTAVALERPECPAGLYEIA